MNKLGSLLLALLLATSAIALAAHGTLHADNGIEQCMLCASHADAKSSLESGLAPALPESLSPTCPMEPALPRLAVIRVASHLARAPPRTV